MSEHWKLHILGARGSRSAHGAAYAEFGGATSCYVLKRGAHAVVIDCGTGLYNAGELLANCETIDVLFTHVHYDHILGLLDTGVFPQDARLTFYGAFSRWLGADTLRRFLSPPFWPYTPRLETVDMPSPGGRHLSEDVFVRFWPSKHPDQASILRIGTDEGSVCVCFDYEHGDAFPDDVARGCAILLYDAAYDAAEYEAHRGWGHSTWQEGVALARRLAVPRLVLTHFAPDRDDVTLRVLERAAQDAYPGARFARMGDVYELGKEDENGGK